MSLDRFERLVLKLANQMPTRYWRHWNHPNEPRLMAVEFFDDPDRLQGELVTLGLERRRHGFYTIERTE